MKSTQTSWGAIVVASACAGAILLTPASEAQQRRPGKRHLDTSLLTPAALPGGSAPSQGGIAGTVLGSWCFEASEGFATVGWVDGQGGWEVSAPAATAEPQISTTNPDEGTQALRFSHDPALGPATGLNNLRPVAFSPNVGAQPPGTYTLTFSFSISGIDAQDYFVIPQAAAEGFVVTYVDISFDGNIYVVDDVEGGLAFVEIGAFTPGAYHEMQVVLNGVAPPLAGPGTIDYFLDGVLVYTGVAWAGQSIDEVVLTTDNNTGGAPATTADFDCVSIAADDEPTPCAGDINGDGNVNVTDLLALISLWGTTPASPNWDPDADLNGNGVVNVSDLLALINEWGPC